MTENIDHLAVQSEAGLVELIGRASAAISAERSLMVASQLQLERISLLRKALNIAIPEPEFVDFDTTTSVTRQSLAEVGLYSLIEDRLQAKSSEVISLKSRWLSLLPHIEGRGIRLVQRQGVAKAIEARAQSAAHLGYFQSVSGFTGRAYINLADFRLNVLPDKATNRRNRTRWAWYYAGQILDLKTGEQLVDVEFLGTDA